jgi:hypothetical protein
MASNKIYDIETWFSMCGTDKYEHGYAPFYKTHLPDNPRTIIEIGVKEGASIRAWKEIYPDALIVGVDLFEEDRAPDIPGAIFIKGDATDPKVLHTLRKFQADVIIDDGSHNSRDQMITFFGLYSGNGQKYFIEDLHCCDEEFYRQGLPVDYTAKHLFSSMVFGPNSQLGHNGKIVVIC